VSFWRRRRHESIVSDLPDAAADDPGFAKAIRRAAMLRALATLPPGHAR